MCKRSADDMDVDMEGDRRRHGNIATGTIDGGKWTCSSCGEWHTASAFQCKWWTYLANGQKHFFYSCETCTLRYQHERAQAQAAQAAQAAAALPANRQELAAWFQTAQTAQAAAEAARAAAEAAEAAPTAASSSASSIFPSRDQVRAHLAQLAVGQVASGQGPEGRLAWPVSLDGVPVRPLGTDNLPIAGPMPSRPPPQ